MNNLFIRTLDNKTLTVNISGVDTVAALKQTIDSKYSIPVQMQQLFNRGELLKDNRPIAYYKLDADHTAKHPLLLTQIFSVDVYISSKVLSLCTLSAPFKNDAVADNTQSLTSQQSIECNSSTTVTSILKQLNLGHLSHLLKICIGTGSQDIRDMDRKLIDIAGLLNEGILSILFSAKWFMDRAMDITHISTLISNIIEKSNTASKSVKDSTSFGRLEHQFDKTQRMILTAFEEIDCLILEQSKEVNNASKWFKKVMDENLVDNDCANNDDNNDSENDDNPESLVLQLSKKVQHLGKTLSAIKRKWHRKRKQIIQYLQKTVRDTEAEQMRQFKTWIASDIVQWLQYMDDRIVFDDDIVHKFVSFNINGFNLSELNDLSMKLMGIHDVAVRQLCIGYIDTLLSKYGADKSCHYSPYCHSPSCSDSSADSEEHSAGHNACCICATNAVSTVIVPCGHAAYCKDCSHEAVKYSNRCPICRTQITQIITVYKAGLEFAQDS